MRAQCAVCLYGIYGACLKWMLPELSFSDRWSRGTKLWERDWNAQKTGRGQKNGTRGGGAVDGSFFSSENTSHVLTGNSFFPITFDNVGRVKRKIIVSKVHLQQVDMFWMCFISTSLVKSN